MDNSDQENLKSKVNLQLLDPLGKGIANLAYQIMRNGKIISKGTTDAKGSIKSFISQIGDPLTLHVTKFSSNEMKLVKTLIPWAEDFSVKLLSGKVKKEIPLEKDTGEPGRYKRKTYIVRPNDSLYLIGKRNGTTAAAIASLNGISVSSIIHPGQVLKVPPDKSDSAPASAPRAPAPAPAAAPPAPAPQPQPAQAPVPPQAPPGYASLPTSSPLPTVPVETRTVEDRGENGTPKAAVELECDKTGCIKLGDTGALVEEINIRLTGFGGTAAAGKKLNEFTAKTEAAVKQFQRDYMGVPETGKVCGKVLVAMDDFRTRYPISLNSMKCECGTCSGFGSSQTTSEKAQFFKSPKQPYKGVEFPGMHRSLLWGFRAALFYTIEKDKQLGYRFLKISSGYRCWYHNKQHSRKTTNHMGNALDIQFLKGTGDKRCSGEDVDKLRADVFVARLGAQMNWTNSNKLSLEPASAGATSWVHVDVREFDNALKENRYYATTQGMADGANMLEAARLEGRLGLINCSGVPPRCEPEKSDRTPIASLSLSKEGLDFIKGWEDFGDKPYDDSEKFCTIGWGHLIAKKSCTALAAAKDAGYEKYKGGVTKAQAEEILKNDVERITDRVATFVQVPLYQQEYDALVSLAFNTGGFSKFLNRHDNCRHS
jgi:GH24 family phage-related lysozyme (muramidase)/murein DD-endopeptidase MepM/ murein hydrolase activator NlpD